MAERAEVFLVVLLSLSDLQEVLLPGAAALVAAPVSGADSAALAEVLSEGEAQAEGSDRNCIFFLRQHGN